MKPAPPFLTLVRHGQSLSNRTRRREGQGNSPLSELGTRQAKRVAARLSGQRFTHAFSSDLSRAVDTARAIGAPSETRSDLRELDMGR